MTTVKEYIEHSVQRNERITENEVNVQAHAHDRGHPGEQERGGVEAQHSQRPLQFSEGEETRSEPHHDVDHRL